MVTKEQIKKEIDNIPDSLLEDVFALLKRLTGKKKHLTWKAWRLNLENFSPDFMENRNQSTNQLRDSFD